MYLETSYLSTSVPCRITSAAVIFLVTTESGASFQERNPCLFHKDVAGQQILITAPVSNVLPASRQLHGHQRVLFSINAHIQKKAETKVLTDPKSKCPHIHSFTYHIGGKGCALFDRVRRRNLAEKEKALQVCQIIRLTRNKTLSYIIHALHTRFRLLQPLPPFLRSQSCLQT